MAGKLDFKSDPDLGPIMNVCLGVGNATSKRAL